MQVTSAFSFITVSLKTKVKHRCLLALLVQNIPSRLWLSGSRRGSMTVHDQFHNT